MKYYLWRCHCWPQPWPQPQQQRPSSPAQRLPSRCSSGRVKNRTRNRGMGNRYLLHLTVCGELESEESGVSEIQNQIVLEPEMPLRDWTVSFRETGFRFFVSCYFLVWCLTKKQCKKLMFERSKQYEKAIIERFLASKVVKLIPKSKSIQRVTKRRERGREEE